MSAARTKKIKSLETVPAEGDPDRKRVLNVLAQRRYRQRRREKFAALEAQAGATSLTKTSQRSPGEEDTETQVGSGRLADANTDPTGGEFTVVDTVAHSPVPHCASIFDFDHEAFETSFMQEYNFSILPTPLPSTPTSVPLEFPLTLDGALLNVPILHALRAFANISTAFGVVMHVWNPSYLHVVSPCIPAVAALPANFKPVPAQLSVPHHPMLDLLPWPGVREKLICMFAMPSAFRPLVAQEDDLDDEFLQVPVAGGSTEADDPIHRVIKQRKAVMQLIQDFEGVEEGGGVRVHGNTTTWNDGNELTEDCWEIGNIFYRKWWWCLDQRIIEVSNRRRRDRGLPQLTMVT